VATTGANAAARRESTLLAVAAQIHARGGSVAEYVDQMRLQSSRDLVRLMIESPEQSTLLKWADSLVAHE
jgi:hypothetical protein